MHFIFREKCICCWFEVSGSHLICTFCSGFSTSCLPTAEAQRWEVDRQVGDIGCSGGRRLILGLQPGGRGPCGWGHCPVGGEQVGESGRGASPALGAASRGPERRPHGLPSPSRSSSSRLPSRCSPTSEIVTGLLALQQLSTRFMLDLQILCSRSFVFREINILPPQTAWRWQWGSMFESRRFRKLQWCLCSWWDLLRVTQLLPAILASGFLVQRQASPPASAPVINVSAFTQ